MTEQTALWRTLKVGDRVRVVALPKGDFNWKILWWKTKRAYRYLVGRKAPLTIYKVDEHGRPWVRFQFRNARGRMEHHFMALNHGGIAAVKKRRRRTE